jgi:hypothetical protein
VSAIVKRLSADRQLTALRTVLDCSVTATALRRGPAAEPEPDPAWLAFLRATQAEHLLQSHVDLWPTP